MIKRTLADNTRVIMAAVNPVPASAYEDDPRAVNEIAGRLTMLCSCEPVSYQQPDRPSRTSFGPQDADGKSRARTITWRLAAPVLSGLAVAGVIVSLTVAGAAPARPGAVTPSVPALPRYYLTISGPLSHAKAIVHGTRTGRTLASISLPGDTEVATVAAAPSDREFFLATVEPGPTNPNTYLFRLRLSASGHWHLSAKTLLISSGSNDIAGVTGIAVSPDGSRLAVAVADFIGASPVPVSEIKVVPLHGGPARIWAAPAHPADLADPVWTSDTSLAFLWLDQLKAVNANSYYAVRTQERLLDTSARSHSVLSSRVLATASGPHGFCSVPPTSPGTAASSSPRSTGMCLSSAPAEPPLSASWSSLRPLAR